MQDLPSPRALARMPFLPLLVLAIGIPIFSVSMAAAESGPAPVGLEAPGDLPADLDASSRHLAERGLALPGAEDPAIRLDPVELPGLRQSVRVRRDANDIPHIFALEDHDALFVLGYLHAGDRFFQMDTLRRQFSGTLAELFGPSALPSDVQFRIFGLRRAAERSESIASEASMAWLEAYTAGVNAWLANNPLPPEYAALEITQAAEWTVLDTLTINKGLAFGLSFGLDELDLSVALTVFQQAGQVFGFDGTALFTEDLYRSAPFDALASVPDSPFAARSEGRAIHKPGSATHIPSMMEYLNGGNPLSEAEKEGEPSRAERALAMMRDYRDRVAHLPWIEHAFERPESPVGSNWWIFDGSLTDSGSSMLANDPHLGLDQPPIFYAVQIRVASGVDKPMNVFGVSFPGTSGIIQGCNPWICWGSTVNPMDVTDVYLEELILDPSTGLPVATNFRDQPDTLLLFPETYNVNVIGDGLPDTLVDSGFGPLEGGLSLVSVRRNFGPIISFDLSNPAEPLGLSVQYTGWTGTQEAEFVQRVARARTVADFQTALQYFDVGSQNWSYADRGGTIAYFTSAEMPIREDLQTLNGPDGGVPPWLVRDGTGTLNHEWMSAQNQQPIQALPYEILPASEMPHVIAPAQGYVLNCNNDPVGTTFDNNALNQLRPGGGIYYLNPGYATGFRQGRLGRLVDDRLATEGSVDMDALQALQANNQLLDAEILVPYLLEAWNNAAGSANPTLGALSLDPRIGEAIGRLDFWDYSTPTGIPEGWDPGDDPSALPMPDATETDASIAATIYSVWRGQVVQAVIDGALTPFGLGDYAPGSSLSMSALRNLLDNFDTAQGVGASGFRFFLGESEVPSENRDVLLLGALGTALDLLASDAFAPAFANSADQADYRWGMLHRIVFDHPLGTPFGIPPAGGLADLSPDLPGIPRSGGLGALDASSHSARADALNEFMFGSGPARRFVGTLYPDGPEAWQVLPGGQSGVLGSPYQADQLRNWLVNDYQPLIWRPLEVIPISETFQQFFPPGGSGS